MSYRILFILSAFVAAVFGGFLLILPETALTLFGTEVYVSTLLVARFFGGAMFMSGLLLWFLKDAFDSKTQRGLGMILLAGSLGGFVLSLIGMTSSGVIRTNGWVLLVIYGLFSLGYAFMLFLQPQMIAPTGYQKQM